MGFTLSARGARSSLAGIALLALIASLIPQPAGASDGPTMDTSSWPAPQADPPVEHDGEHVVVAFQGNTEAADRAAAHSAANAAVVNRMAWANADVVRISAGGDPEEVAQRYLRNPNVRSAEPNWLLRPLSVPNDYFFEYLWNLNNTGQALYGGGEYGTVDADIDAPEAWDLAFGTGNFPNSGGTRVGILDTGIDQDHDDLVGKTKACAQATTGTGAVVEGLCDDRDSHGTHMAGMIGAHANNWYGVAGAAPDAEFAVFNVQNAGGGYYYIDVLAGIRWLRTTGQAEIINMSLGVSNEFLALSLFDQELSDAYSAGTLLIAAAGNGGCYPCYSYPASHPDVISVAATDKDDVDAYFSNCNDDVEIAAPGVRVGSTWINNGYGEGDGTSIATAQVSGAAALVMSERGTTAAETRAILTSTADDVGPAGHDVCTGAGRVNLLRALGGTPQPVPIPGVVSGTITDQAGNLLTGWVDCGEGHYDYAPDGYYEIRQMPAGAYTCTANAYNYRSKSQHVTVTEGTTTTLNFMLRKGNNR